MGSKLGLLSGQLGEILHREAAKGDRFVDLFAGSASVSHFVAEEIRVPVLSIDLQHFSSPLALSITGRTSAMDPVGLRQTWIRGSRQTLNRDAKVEIALHASRSPSKTSIGEARRLYSANSSHKSFILRHYGGHYFSPIQALAMDHLFKNLPSDPKELNVAKAALLRAASNCAAAPGHTAQPFQPTPTLLPYIRGAWAKNIFEECEKEINAISLRSAKAVGSAVVANGIAFTKKLKLGDVVFCDPPYSNAQYSRFYHVLEGIAIGGWPSVGGAGRAPSRELRSTSTFSNVGSSYLALEQLFTGLRNAGATAVMTFPAGEASNGLSGNAVKKLAGESFKVEATIVPHTHSTLGGSKAVLKASDLRGSRRQLDELVLILRPKPSRKTR